ncbi:18583_t:CDS:2, partial [Acaulospora morrowiae]
MLGAFRATVAACGGLLWKRPMNMNKTRKANVRKRLKAVDRVIAAVAASGVKCKAL